MCEWREEPINRDPVPLGWLKQEDIMGMMRVDTYEKVSEEQRDEDARTTLANFWDEQDHYGEQKERNIQKGMEQF
jgi:hypothetical protein